MNRTLSYGAKLFAHLDPSKGVDAYRQQDGGHGSRNPLRSVIAIYTHSRMSYEYKYGISKYDTITLLVILARQPHCGESLTLHCIRSCHQLALSVNGSGIVTTAVVSIQRNPQLYLTIATRDIAHRLCGCRLTDLYRQSAYDIVGPLSILYSMLLGCTR